MRLRIALTSLHASHVQVTPLAGLQPCKLCISHSACRDGTALLAFHHSPDVMCIANFGIS